MHGTTNAKHEVVMATDKHTTTDEAVIGLLTSDQMGATGKGGVVA